MKYSKTGFRPLYHNFCIFPINKTTKKIIENYPGASETDGVLTYGYYDRECGLTLEALACAKKTGKDQYAFAPGSEEIRSIIRIGAVADDDYVFVGYGDDPISENFKDKL